MPQIKQQARPKTQQIVHLVMQTRPITHLQVTLPTLLPIQTKHIIRAMQPTQMFHPAIPQIKSRIKQRQTIRQHS